MARGLVAGFAAAALAGLSVSAQQPARPVFTSAANVARIDVQVVDASGEPIPDLRPDEIQIIENGVARPVLLLQHIAEAGRTYAESAMRTIASEVSTNQGAPRGQLYVLLFDQAHITPGREQRVRAAAERFILDKIQPQDRVAVFGVPLPGPSLGFTSNPRTAVAQLQNVHGSLERLTSGIQLEMTTYEAFAIQRGNVEVLNRFLVVSPDGTATRASALADAVNTKRGTGESQDSLKRLVEENAKIVINRADGDSRRFLQTTAEILRSLRNVDGRKNILLFSEGFFGDNLASELRNVASAAAEVYGVVYAFDLNDRLTNLSEEPRGNDAAAEVLARTESIGGIATDTNGAVIIDAVGHIDSALAKLALPANDYYIVGFEPPADALSDRTAYRRIDVKVTRPGATARTRTGYAAGADGHAMALPSIKRLTIDNALAAPFGHQGFRVEYTTYQTRGAGGTERIVLSLEAELPVAAANDDSGEPGTRNLEPGTRNLEPVTKADVVFVVRNARTGQLVTSGADEIPLPAQPSPGLATGIGSWRVQFALAPGDYLMRCVIREPGGLLGSADRQFTVRSLTGPDVSASDLLLGKPGQQLPVRATAYKDESFPGAVRLFGRSATQLDRVSAHLELIPTGGSTPAVGVNAVPSDLHDASEQPQRDLFFDVPLASVPPGDYVARAEIRANGELVTELRRQVRVVDGTAPRPADEAKADVAGVSARHTAAAAGDAASARDAAVASDAASSEIARSLTGAAADGVALLKAAKYADAVTSLTAVFDADPKNAAVAFVLGWAHRGAGNMTSAVAAFRGAAYLNPAMIPAHLALADTYMHMQQRALAIQALQAGLAIQPNAIELTRMLEAIKK